jgi:hypothetical protein
MALCSCDGPPHTYDPSWCVNPRFGPGERKPTTVVVPPGATVIIIPPK